MIRKDILVRKWLGTNQIALCQLVVACGRGTHILRENNLNLKIINFRNECPFSQVFLKHRPESEIARRGLIEEFTCKCDRRAITRIY
jgi:hypothetical protein